MELTIEQALNKGVAAHKEGNLQEADRCYTAILKVQPHNSDANHNMGVLSVGIGKIEESLTFFKTALEANPNIDQYWISYIEALIKLEKLNDAKAILDEAKNNVAKGEAFDKLVLKLKNIKSSGSVGSQKKAIPQIELHPLISLYNNRNFQQALKKVSDLVQKYPNSEVLYNISGAVNHSLGKFDKAIESFKQAINLKPDYAKAYFNMASTLKEQGKLYDAVEAYQKTLSIKTDYFEAYFNMGNILKELGELEDAVQAYKNTLSINPNYAEASYNMGITFREMGQLEESVEAYKKTLSIRPDFSKAYNNMGNALLELGKLDDALEAYKNTLSTNPNYAEACYNMGVTLKELGKLEEAIEAYKKTLLINPEYSDAYYNMGNIFQEQGKLVDAVLAYKNAISINPEYADAYNNMGNTFKDQGLKEKAIEAYQKTLAINPDYDATRINLGVLLYENKQYKKASELFSLDMSSYSQSNLLKCFYELRDKPKFLKQLDYLVERGDNNAIIGSFLYRAEVSFGIKRNNPFCNKPFSFVSKFDLNQVCDFKKIFVNNISHLLGNSKIEHKTQGHLTNGIQTSGNIFTQAGSVTNKWQDIIHSQLKKYKDLFIKSEEGFIKNWPSNYSIYGWVVSMKSGGELSAHIHDTGWVTGSIYINVPPKSKKDSGNLVLTTCDEINEGSSTENVKSIDVVTGSLCLFPSSLLHYTVPFESKENRIVLAFDIIPEN